MLAFLSIHKVQVLAWCWDTLGEWAVLPDWWCVAFNWLIEGVPNSVFSAFLLITLVSSRRNQSSNGWRWVINLISSFPWADSVEEDWASHYSVCGLSLVFCFQTGTHPSLVFKTLSLYLAFPISLEGREEGYLRGEWLLLGKVYKSLSCSPLPFCTHKGPSGP